MNDKSMARPILGLSFLLGVAGDSLLRGEPGGLGFPIWTALLALTMVSLAGRAGRIVSGQAAAWLATAVLFSAAMAWRDSDMLQLLNSAVTMAAFGMAAITVSDARRALFAPRLRDTVWAGGTLLGRVAAGVAPLLIRDAELPRTPKEKSRRMLPAFRAAGLAGVLLLIFGSLLRADPLFASLVALPRIDLDFFLGHAVAIGFLAWIVGGWARGALLSVADPMRPPESLPFSLGLLDITAALGSLTVLFTAFVATQLGWFFGGEQFLQDRTGLTAAEYARKGFFQMVWVVLLVVGVLLATRATLRPGRVLALRHTALSLPLIALLGAIIFSAVMRMRLYTHYYGLTEDRVYALVFMGWLAVVVVWLAVTVLRGWGRPFVAGAAVSGLVILAALNIVAPDALIARVNIERAARAPNSASPPLDLVHVAKLSGEATELAVAAILSSENVDSTLRCEAARVLLDRWGRLSRAAQRSRLPASWRTWNAGEVAAVRVVAEREGELLQLRRAGCPRPSARP
jgi:hypothetical protein